MEDFDMKRIERAASFCPNLFGATEGNEQNIAEIVSISKKLFALVETHQPQNPLELYALRCDCIYGNITLAFEKTNELFQKISTTSATTHEELSKEDFIV
ncbi:jg9178, partial [Pararge aegeria aegeria]